MSGWVIKSWLLGSGYSGGVAATVANLRTFPQAKRRHFFSHSTSNGSSSTAYPSSSGGGGDERVPNTRLRPRRPVSADSSLSFTSRLTFYDPLDTPVPEDRRVLSGSSNSYYNTTGGRQISNFFGTL